MLPKAADILEKLRQIETLSEAALDQPGSGQEEIRLVIGLAKYLITEIEMTWRAV